MSQIGYSTDDIYVLTKLFSCNEIKLSAWNGNENGKGELLVVYLTSGDFICYYLTEEEPIVKRIPWFTDPLHSPVSIDLSPSGIFLLVLSNSCNLYILPVLPTIDDTFRNETFLDGNDLTIHTYPFTSKAASKQNKNKMKSPNSSLSYVSSLSLQSGSSNSSSNDRQRSFSSSSSSFSDSQANENINKLKEISCTKYEVYPSAACWWESIHDCQQVGIIGTKSGDIVFVDLFTGLKIGETSVKGEVKTLSICQDKSLDNVFLLITAGNDEQYKLILEQKQLNHIWSGKQNLSFNEEVNSADGSHSVNGNYLPSARARLQGLKQMSAEKLASLKQKIAETRSKIGVKQGTIEETSSKPCGLLPENLGSIIGDTLISPQQFHEGNVLTSYYAPSQLLTIHAMNLDTVPLFIHKMPEETEEVLLCDNVIYVISNNRTALQVISVKLTETWIELINDFNTDSVLGNWDLKKLNETDRDDLKLSKEHKPENPLAKPDLIPEDLSAENEEKILSVHKCQGKLEDYDVTKVFKLEKTKEELPDCPKIENCIVVTNRSVYLVRLNSNVIKIALDLILHAHELEKAERICTIYGIDLQKLLELAGDIKLAALDFPTAIALYKLTKCGLLKGIIKLACGNHCSQVLNYSTMLMANSISDLSLTERIHLSNLILMAYTQQILKNDNNRSLMEKFLEFLQTNSYFDQVLAVSVTGQSLLFTCLHKLLRHRGLVLEGYNVLIKLMERFLNSKVLEWNLNKEEFWKCATEVDLIEAMVIKSTTFSTYVDYVSQHLDDLEPACLDRLLQVLDPTSACVRPVARVFKNSNESFDNDDTQAVFPFGKLVEIFLVALMVKLRKMNNGGKHYDRALLLPSQEISADVDFSKLGEPESFGSSVENLNDEIWPIRKEMQAVDNEKYEKKLETVVDCGYGHTALIRNGDVFTWGQTAKGCLGQGPTMSRYASPTPVTWMTCLKLEVSVVACGKYHTVALTNNGVYAWGCSRYGQLGLGDVAESPHPRLVKTIANENVITVSCGQYHTLALTNRGSVFAWGWGVHGQLGLGSVEDRRYPTYVENLRDQLIVDVAGGHGHSLVLSDKGHVYSFGSSIFGQLGIGTNVKNSVPVLVRGINGKVVSIATGYFHSLALTESNKLYGWGSSPQCLRLRARKRLRLLQNQSSSGSSSDVDSSEWTSEEPSEANGLLDKTDSEMHLSPSIVDTSNVSGNIIQISCGCHHSALVTDSGGLYTWGKSIDGQLGNGGHREICVPTQINPNGFRVDHVSCGCEFTTAQEKYTGKIFCWGSNAVGQLAIPVKESATGSLDGKLVMLKSCKRIVRLLDRNVTSNSVDLPREVPGIPLRTFTYQTLTKHTSSNSKNLSDFDPGYSERSLHFAIENFGHCIDLGYILKKSLEYGNYQAASKISLLQNKCKQSVVYQLKALQSVPEYHRSGTASHSGKPGDDKGETPKSDSASAESEIHLFTVQGGREDMCDESRFRDVGKLPDEDFFDQIGSGKTKDDDPSMTSCISPNPVKMEYVDHAKYILEAYLDLNSSQLYEDCDNSSILETGIHFWTAEKLPMVELENFLISKLDEIFYDVGYLLFCQNRRDHNQITFLEQFSTSFLLAVTSKILSRIEKNESCLEYLEAMSKILVTDGAEGKISAASKKNKGLIKSKKAKSETYLETIKENLKRQWINENHIKISYGDVIGDSVYFFSCGHYHSSKSLKEECRIFEEMSDEVLAKKFLNLYQVLEVKNEGDLACPLCLRNYFRQ